MACSYILLTIKINDEVAEIQKQILCAINVSFADNIANLLVLYTFILVLTPFKFRLDSLQGYSYHANCLLIFGTKN